MTSPTPLTKTSSVQGIALRVTRLDSTGKAITGTTNAYTMNRFVSVTFTPVYDGANNIQQQLANGNFAVTFQTSDIFQRIECSMNIAGPDPEFNEIAVGGTLLTDSGVVVGWKPTSTGTVDNANGVAVEVWSYAITGSRPATDRPYYHWLFPRLFMHPSDDKTLENDVMSWTMSGWGNENPNFATGPHVPGWIWTSDRPYQYARTTTAPTGVNGYEVF